MNATPVPTTPTTLTGHTLIAGHAQADVVWSDVGLSFWGGVDPATGTVVDRHHPLHGECIRGKVLAIAGGRGSCTGSSVMLELLLTGNAPAALVLRGPDDILLLGVLVAQWMFGRSLPVVSVTPDCFAQLRELTPLDVLALASHDLSEVAAPPATALAQLKTTPWPLPPLALSPQDDSMLSGAQGQAKQVAMQIITHMARLNGATQLLDITQAHIDGCIYTGQACLRFAQQLVQWGGQVAVPTSLNAISVDRCGWRAQGVPAAFGESADALAQAYVDLGCAPTYTCAPYLLTSAPQRGEHIAWAESNAVVFANSVIGARTAKYPDFLDILMALTGRAPASDCHLDAPRLARVQVNVTLPALWDAQGDDSLYPLLGYQVGLLAARHIPVICGLEQAKPSLDDLRALGAAFATTSSAPMFHVVGVTPEASTLAQALGGPTALRQHTVTLPDLFAAWRELNTAPTRQVELVALGNPHLSPTELVQLSQLCQGTTKHEAVDVIVTTARFVLDDPALAVPVKALQAFGVRFVVDACWCMLQEPLVAPRVQTIMTNSGKYAHYAPGLVGRKTCFGSLADCVSAACTGLAPATAPEWLRAQDGGFAYGVGADAPR